VAINFQACEISGFHGGVYEYESFARNFLDIFVHCAVCLILEVSNKFLTLILF
jgi:hypothetical protein